MSIAAIKLNRILALLILALVSFGAYSQESSTLPFMPKELKKIVLMQPTGELDGDLPEMRLLNDTTEAYRKAMQNIKYSFVDEFLDLYFISQIYLKNQNKGETIEPAFLALTENQGGFAKFGFSILEGDGHTIKSQTPYIDITVDQATSPANKLMSLTQLYPHEMGHVFFHLLSPEDSISNNTKNVDMHFFSIVTDYSTAFNEGFAEHIENVSRYYEKNEDIASGISAEIKRIEQLSKPSIAGFKRDFVYPFRLGFYKASMLSWYQKYEDYKRYALAFSGDIKYKSKALRLSNIEDALTFRNSGVELNKNEKRNLVQLNSTEGAISSFFTHLSTSDLRTHYLDSTFYLPFLYEGHLKDFQTPEQVFTPLQNQFIKYFYVLHNFVTVNNSTQSQLTDFIDCYMQSFPSEEYAVKEIYKEALGVEYSNQLPPPLWLLVKNYSHRLLVFDSFDAITLPVYTFDLNAAEVEDLQTIEGVTFDVAHSIVNYRNTNGFFTNLNQLKKIPELPEDVANKIIATKLDTAYFEESLENFQPKLSVKTLLLSPLKYIFSRATIYFLFLFLILYFTMLKRATPTHKQMVFLFVKYYVLWVLFVLTGAVAVFLTARNAYLYPLLLFVFTALTALLVYRKRRVKFQRTLIFTGLMILLVLFSIV